MFPHGHLSRIGGTFDGTLAASAIRDADPAAAPPEIRTLSGLTDTEIGQIRAKVGPLILAYNAFLWEWGRLGLWEWGRLGLADLLGAMTADELPGFPHARLSVEAIRAQLGETASFYAWAMKIANRAGPQPSA